MARYGFTYKAGALCGPLRQRKTLAFPSSEFLLNDEMMRIPANPI